MGRNNAPYFWRRWEKCSENKRGYLIDIFPPNFFDYFVDIGANVGKVCFPFFIRNPLTQIIAFEPCMTTYNKLKDKFVSSSLNLENVKLVNLAMGDGSYLYLDRQYKGGVENHPRNLFIKEDTNDDKISSLTLSDIFKNNNINLEKKIFLKIDCEGGERFLLDDNIAIEIIIKCTHIAIEVHFPIRLKHIICDIRSDKRRNERFRFNSYKFPTFSKHDKWIRNNFEEKFKIKYHKEVKGKGFGTYILTKKDIEVD